MKSTRSLWILAPLALALSCSDSSDAPLPGQGNPLADLNEIASIQANGHTLEIHSARTGFVTGYNELFIRIKDGQDYVKEAVLEWKPLMHMGEMVHSCPASPIGKSAFDTVYQGFIVFQMPGNASEYWDLELDYSFGGQTHHLSERIEVSVPSQGKRVLNVFTGSDGIRYVLAMKPLEPKVAVNDFSALLFKMENMMEFPPVEGYRIALDPRMPSMGNHGSPNNVDLTHQGATASYNGKLSLTMTGHWRINLKLFDAGEVLLGGTEITDENPESDLFFELEF